mmetsp:Transcript_12372/g.8598  ORF Transcript_12372/g.8598 Transcript_12372/m.8598 type:complete len:205 (+) Transcript_12372:353-967(+)
MKDNTNTSKTTNMSNTAKSVANKPKTEIWNQKKQPLQEEEELEYDSRAYTMLHRAKVEWPCLSMDCLVKERCALDGPNNPTKWFPSQLGSNEFDHTQSFMDKNNIRRHKGDRFPMTVYFVAGSQAEKKSDNKIYVMKWTDMHKTVNQDDELSDSDEENDKYQEPTLRYEAIPHRGSINRIRSMYGSPIVATWNEDAELAIYNVS